MTHGNTPATLPVIYAFVAFETLQPNGHSFWPDGCLTPVLQRLCHGRAVTEDGTVLDADHPSSSPEWSRSDMEADGKPDLKHERVYAVAYPGGFRVEWVDEPMDHPVVGPMLRSGHPRLTDPGTAG